MDSGEVDLCDDKNSVYDIVHHDINDESIKNQGVYLIWQDLSVKTSKKRSFFKNEIKPQKEILNNISGIASPGDCIAIMGSSGAGKTTFLNTLANRNTLGKKITGQVLVNGKHLGSDISKISEYVQQDDLFYGEFTVREHLKFQANLRNIKNADQRITDVISEMGLEDCADEKIGTPRSKKSISGGERKRLSFATKILKKPKIIFCDEPTSGLDSFLAHQVVNSLKKIARNGTIVITTIHQPPSETFNSFDKIILLAKGECAFIGKRTDAGKYFSEELNCPCPISYNPADHYINILSVDPKNVDKSKLEITDRCLIFRNSDFYEVMNNEIEKFLYTDKNDQSLCLPELNLEDQTKTKIAKQLKWLFWRSAIINYRDPLVSIIKIVQTIVMSIVLALIYLNVPYQGYIGVIQKCVNGTPSGAPITATPEILNINGALFVVLINSSFPFVFFVTNVFPFILPAWREEYYGGLYSITIAYLSELLAQIPLIFLLQIILCSITYWLFGLVPTFSQFIIYFFILELIAQCASGFGLMISSLSSNIVVIQAVTPALLVPLMIFGGFFVQNNAIPVYLNWIKYISWFFYGNMALQINQWENQLLNCQLCNGTTLSYDDCPKNLQYTGDLILESSGMTELSLWSNIAIIGGLSVSFRLLAYISLLWKFREGNR